MFQGEIKGLKFTKRTCENVYVNKNISNVRHYQTKLQLELKEELY